MRQYFCFSPRGVEAGGGAAWVILREVEVTVGLRKLSFYFYESFCSKMVVVYVEKAIWKSFLSDCKFEHIHRIKAMLQWVFL